MGIGAVRPEPVEQWRPLLQRFYEDQRRWAFSLQAQVLASYANMMADLLLPSSLVITERSPYSSIVVFAAMLQADAVLEEVELHLLAQLAQQLGSWRPDAMVYVHTPPEICAARMAVRSRSEEAGVPLSYLYNLQQQHILALGIASMAVPVFVVDGTADEVTVATSVASAVRFATDANGALANLAHGIYTACALGNWRLM